MNAITLCNLALGMLGLPNIVSFEDQNNNAKWCKLAFPILRDRVLRDHVWSFATESAELQPLKEKSFDPEFPLVAALPGDLLRVIEVMPEQSPYRRIGKKIYVKTLPATLVYVRRVTDTEELDDTFCDALQYLLASELCMANTKDANLVNYYTQRYREVLATARAIDSQENYFANQPPPQYSSFIASRFGGGRQFHPVRFVED